MVDGTVVATQKMENTIPFGLPLDETFDIGSKTGTPVDETSLRWLVSNPTVAHAVNEVDD